MAKKKIEEAIIIAEETPLHPALVEIKKEYGLKIADEIVDRHALTYVPFYSQLVELETELEKLLVMEPDKKAAKAAKELRLKYVKIRTASGEQKKTDKADILIEGNLLDAINKRVEEGAKTKEAKCLEVEKHLEKIETDRVNALISERKEVLDNLGADTDFIDLGAMPQASFERMVAKAKENNAAAELLAEAKRKQEEEEAKRAEQAELTSKQREARISELGKIGWFYNQELDTFEDEEYTRPATDLMDCTAEQFAEEIKAMQCEYVEAQEAKEEERKKKELVNNRVIALTKLGLALNEEETAYEGFEHSILFTDVMNMTSEEFKKMFDDAKIKINQIHSDRALKAAADKKKAEDDAAEVERLRKEKADSDSAKLKLEQEQAAAKEASLKAPDKEKFLAFCKEFGAITVPTMTSNAGQLASSQMTSEIAKLKAIANDIYKTLK